MHRKQGKSKENNNVGEGISVVSGGIELILRFFSQDKGLTHTEPGRLLPNHCLTPGETFSLGCSTSREGKKGSG